MNEHIVEYIYSINDRSYRIVEAYNNDIYFYVEYKTIFRWKKANSIYIKNKFDTIEDARLNLYKFNSNYKSYVPRSNYVLKGKDAIKFINNINKDKSDLSIDNYKKDLEIAQKFFNKIKK